MTDTSKTVEKSIWTLNVCVVSKDEGNGRRVVDCNRPHYNSVTTYTDHVANKFSYKGVDQVTYVMYHCFKVGKDSKTFSCHLRDLITQLKELFHTIRFDIGKREDRDWWLGFAMKSNGLSWRAQVRTTNSM